MQNFDASELNLHFILFILKAKHLINLLILINTMNSFMKIIDIVRMPKTDFVHRFNNLNILFIKP